MFVLWAIEEKASMAWCFNLRPSGEPEWTAGSENVVMDMLQRGLMDLNGLRKELLEGLRLVVVSIGTSIYVDVQSLERLRWGHQVFLL